MNKGIITGEELIKLHKEGKSIINPFVPEKVLTDINGNPILSYGLEPAGYTVRLATVFKRLTVSKTPLVPFFNDEEKEYEIITTDAPLLLEPNEVVLGITLEYLKMPRDVLGIGHTKSSYARGGIFINVTPIDPGWEGNLTLAISNLSGRKTFIFPRQGIIQIIFFRLGQETKGYYGYFQKTKGKPVATRKGGKNVKR